MTQSHALASKAVNLLYTSRIERIHTIGWIAARLHPIVIRSSDRTEAVGKAKTKRQQDLHDFKRARIVAAAEKIFLAQGIEGASLRAIAREAGYTPGALYAYYASKEEL